MSCQANRIRFALAGRIVSKSSRARRIKLNAIKHGQDWLVEQAKNVELILKRARQ